MGNLETILNPSAHGDQPADDLIEHTKAARRVGILVLGMHRSGSSAITRMLSLLGCTLPQTPMPPAFDNPRGHWESQRVADFNDEILTVAGTQWDDWQPVNPRLSETLVWPQLVARGRDVLRQEFANAPLFVLKDPRICKLGGFWLEVLATEGIDAAFVLPLRNPIEVARSLEKRDGIEEHQGLLIWLRHVLAAEAASRGRARVFTEYAALLERWEELSGRLSAGLSLAWPRVSALSGSEIAQFLTPELRHHVSNTTELGNNPAISPWVQKTYEVLLGWARFGENTADHAVLDQIAREFDAAGTAFSRPMLNARRAVERAAQADAETAVIAQERGALADERNRLAEERDALAQRLGAVEAEFTQVCTDRDARTAERDELAAGRAAVTEEHDRIARRLSEVEAEAAQVQVDRDALAAERNELAANTALLVDERDKLAWRLGEVEAWLAQARVERDTQSAERVELAGQNAWLAEERAKLAWRLGEAEADFARACNDRDMRTAERDQLATERDGLAKERNKVAWHLGEVEADLANAKGNYDSARTRIDGLGDELAAAHAAATALQHRLAVSESTLRQREEEIAQLGAELEAHRLALAQHSATSDQLQRELRDAYAARQAAEDRIRLAEDEKHVRNSQLADRFAELAELTRMLLQKDGELDASKTELTETRARLESRFTEIAQLTQLYRQHELRAEAQQEKVEWLRRIYATLNGFPRWWGIMPTGWRRKRELRRLKRRGMFDGDAYIARYPDISEEGMEPLRHYILHGMAEGRLT